MITKSQRFACAMFLASTGTFASEAQFDALRNAVETYNRSHGAAMLRSFRDFLSLPNVSTQQADMVINAQWIIDYITPRGFEAKTVTAGRAPYVIAHRHVDDDAKTVLIYAHFDGQPARPKNWSSPPFTPTLRDGETTLDWEQALQGEISPEWRIYARSAGDDKAPIIALMQALDAMAAAQVPVGVNIKLILDGEEEFGSPTLEQILQRHGDELAADLMLFCDGPMHQSRQRQVVFGVRGDTGVTLTTYGPSRPLHSGHYGNWAPHPTDRLIRLLASLKNIDGSIAVSGYLDEVRPISAAERAAIDAMPKIDRALQKELALGSLEGDGERLEALIMRPAIIVKGLQAGGVGAQARNIILPTATASLDLRLVPDQSVEHAREALEAHFVAQGFHLVHDDPSDADRRAYPKVLKVDWSDSGYRAFRTDLNGAEAQELIEIITNYDRKPPLLTPTMGGSLPIYLFEDYLRIPIVILPIANHDNNQHGRDENIRLANLFDAVGLYAAVVSAYGR